MLAGRLLVAALPIRVDELDVVVPVFKSDVLKRDFLDPFDEILEEHIHHIWLDVVLTHAQVALWVLWDIIVAIQVF